MIEHSLNYFTIEVPITHVFGINHPQYCAIPFSKWKFSEFTDNVQQKTLNIIWKKIFLFLFIFYVNNITILTMTGSVYSNVINMMSVKILSLKPEKSFCQGKYQNHSYQYSAHQTIFNGFSCFFFFSFTIEWITFLYQRTTYINTKLERRKQWYSFAHFSFQLKSYDIRMIFFFFFISVVFEVEQNIRAKDENRCQKQRKVKNETK